MRLSHYALALTIILLAITGYLAWEAQEEAKGARKELELVRRQQAAHDMAVPAKPGTVAALPPPPELPPQHEVPRKPQAYVVEPPEPPPPPPPPFWPVPPPGATGGAYAPPETEPRTVVGAEAVAPLLPP